MPITFNTIHNTKRTIEIGRKNLIPPASIWVINSLPKIYQIKPKNMANVKINLVQILSEVMLTIKAIMRINKPSHLNTISISSILFINHRFMRGKALIKSFLFKFLRYQNIMEFKVNKSLNMRIGTKFI